MRTLIAVLLLTGGAAAAEPLKPAKVLQGFRGTTFDGRWGMTTENNAVGIWDLKLGRQVGAVDVPGWDPGYIMVYAATRPTEQLKVVEILDQQLRLAADKGFSEE